MELVLNLVESLISILRSGANARISKSKIGLCADKIVITIGYNASRLQHHRIPGSGMFLMMVVIREVAVMKKMN